ncbi:MAG: phosphotransferase, partial [Chloroflexi bacterium]|nr:phosphotransferase [Chloroflexota bacterium]
FVDYGRLIGKMHRLTKAYTPANPAWKRLEWDSLESMEVERQLPKADTLILERFQTLMQHLQSLPKGRDSYGLIHQDAHGGNFFVDEAGQITLFDFDDSAYGHFAYDVAMVLFYAVTNHENVDTFAPQFWHPCWQGYCEENQLDPVWLKEIPHFLKLREIDLYAVIHRSFDLDNLNDGWVAQFMNGRKQNIEQAIPYINTDFLL